MDANLVRSRENNYLAAVARAGNRSAVAHVDVSTGASGTGSVNVVSRSGSNEFHGNGYIYWRDDSFAAFPGLSRLDAANGIPASERERNRNIQETEFGGFKRALAAGLPIGFATDAMVIEHGENAKECEVRGQLGEQAMACIVAATSLNAEIMGWSDRVGSIERGKFADLVDTDVSVITLEPRRPH